MIKTKNFFSKNERNFKKCIYSYYRRGGIRQLKDIEKLLKNGADKVVLNTVAIKDPKIINSAAKEFGSQCIVICIDVKSEDNNFYLMEEYGQKKSSTNLIEYLKKIQDENAGEVFLQSVNQDGSLLGYDLKLLEKIHPYVKIPLIISCGAGNWDHVKEVLNKEYISGASLTNIFHFTEKSIKILKNHIKDSIFIRD